MTTTQPRLIGLCSPAMFSGKTTAANYLCMQHGFTKLSFATTLKKMTETFLHQLGMSALEIADRTRGTRKEQVIPEIGVSARRIMQSLGTEWGRQCIKDSLWVDITLHQAVRLMALGHSVVVDDLRFPNEHDAIHAAGGDTWRIVRPDARVTVAHASEGQLDLIHMPEIFNGGSVVDLHAAVDRALGIN